MPIAVNDVAVVPVEPLVGAEPEKPRPVLEDALDVGAGETGVGRELAETQLLGTRGNDRDQRERGAEQRCASVASDRRAMRWLCDASSFHVRVPGESERRSKETVARARE